MFLGSIVVLIILFILDGEVDYISLKKLVDFYVDVGIDVIVFVGITGEFVMLMVEEYVKVVVKMVEFVEGCLFIIVGIGVNVIYEVVIFSCLLNNIGIVGYLSVMFYYNKLI